MKNTNSKTLVLLIVILALSGSLFSQNFPDTKGREFYLTFMPVHAVDYYTEDSLSIFINADKPTTGVIEYRDINNKIYTSNFSITDINEIYKFSVVAKNFELVGYNYKPPINQCEAIAKQSFRITSDEDITVYGKNIGHNSYSGDAFLAFPVDALDRQYFVMTYNNTKDSISSANPSEFAVIATQDSTGVIIKPTAATRLNGLNEQHITLGKGDVYLVQVDTYKDKYGDLTGTEIIADKPIALFAGHMGAGIPNTLVMQNKHYLVEQLPPVSAWGKNAFIIPFYPAHGDERANYKDIYRVMAVTLDKTTVKINGIETVILNKGEFIEREITGPVSIEADKSIMTAQFKKSASFWGHNHGNVSMMILPPIEQFMDNYRVFNIREISFWDTSLEMFSEHYLAVVVPQASYKSLTIDGIFPEDSCFKPIPGSGYLYANIEVKSGIHSLECDKPFGVTVYGYGDWRAYSYMGAMSMKRFDTNLPEIMGSQNCYIAEGFISDTLNHDSGLETVSAPADSMKNVDAEILKQNSKFYSYKASLVNRYYDGHFDILAVDSAGLKVEKGIDIPGFTVWLKNENPNGEPAVFSNEAKIHREFCSDIIFNNYGGFSQNIKEIKFKNNVFSIKSGTFGKIIIGEEKTLTYCFTPVTVGTYTDTLLISNDCETREAAYITIQTQLDKNPPKLVIQSDTCGENITISVSDSLFTDSGLHSVIMNELVNCTQKDIISDVKCYNFNLGIINPYLDAIYDISATDEFGYFVNMRDTIQGFTLKLGAKDGNDILDFGINPIGMIKCDSLTLENYGLLPLVFENALIADNILFSIPQTQFPLEIAPGEKKKICICYMPSDFIGESNNDSLKIDFKCLSRNVQLTGLADILMSEGENRCKLPFRIISGSVPSGYFLEQNIPNPVTDESTKIRFGLNKENRVCIDVYSINGEKAISIADVFCQAGTYEVDFDTGELQNGVYFYVLRVADKSISKKMVIIK
jgi:hypothetical protein